MAKQIKTTEVPKRNYRDYWEKAQQMLRVMRFCLEDNQWDAVLFNGVHACICASDALAVFCLGKRSTAQSHQDAILLLKQAARNADSGKYGARFSEILNLKHLVEYEPRRFDAAEGSDFAKKVERFINWIQTQLPS